MTTTMSRLVDDTILYLQGFVQTQDQQTHIISAIDADDLSVTVSDPSKVQVGLAEIDTELVYISTVNQTTGVCAIAPYGRGYRSTAAASHAAGSRITFAPAVPRSAVLSALNEAILGVYPRLVAYETDSFEAVAGYSTYDIPNGMPVRVAVVNILDGRENPNLRRWRWDHQAGQIVLFDGVPPGWTVEVTVAKEPSTVAIGGNFEDSGLPSSCIDVIRLGAASRLTPLLEFSSVTSITAEADFNGQRPVTGTTLSRFLMQMYDARLDEESIRQARLNPVRAHFTN